MIKKIFIFIIISLFVFQAQKTNAQSTNTTQKALNDVKERVEMLIEAKDENNPNEIALRVEAFKKVLSFSITEAKNLKSKLLSFEKGNEIIEKWKKNTKDGLEKILEYYINEQSAIKEKENFSIEEIKGEAEQFKSWREKEFLPLSDEINGFILVKQQGIAIETAEKRLEKIKNDLEKIKKTKIKKWRQLEPLLKKSESLINDAVESNNKAESLFQEKYLKSFSINSTSSATSTISEDEKQLENSLKDENSKEDADKEIDPPQPVLSIKDLVQESVKKIKEAYQIFIEMSNLVRK